MMTWDEIRQRLATNYYLRNIVWDPDARAEVEGRARQMMDGIVQGDEAWVHLLYGLVAFFLDWNPVADELERRFARGGGPRPDKTARGGGASPA